MKNKLTNDKHMRYFEVLMSQNIGRVSSEVVNTANITQNNVNQTTILTWHIP